MAFFLPQAEGSLFLLLLCLPPGDKADPEPCACFLLRETVFSSLVDGAGWVLFFAGQSLYLDIGREMSRGMFWGSCELIMALSSLSSDEWGCVPLLLVVWPEDFQLRSLQVFQCWRWDLQGRSWQWALLPQWSLCFPESYGAPTLKPHWPSRLNALGVLLHARHSDCLEDYFYVRTSLCSLLGFNMFWCEGCFNYRYHYQLNGHE